MVVGDNVCELTDGFLWFVCGNFDSPLTSTDIMTMEKIRKLRLVYTGCMN